jgi:hypothetical protein
MDRVSGRAIGAATRRALDDATIQVAVKGALVQKDLGSGLRSRSQGSNRPNMQTSPLWISGSSEPVRSRVSRVPRGVPKDPAPRGLEIRNCYGSEPRRVSLALS